MTDNKQAPCEEKIARASNGMAVLIADIILSLAAIAAIVAGAILVKGHAVLGGVKGKVGVFLVDEREIRDIVDRKSVV